MKTQRRPHSPSPQGPTPSQRARGRREGEQGIAIITVLAVLLLMSVLVLAFFQMAATEYIASNNYDYSIRSRQAADSVISIVTSQIRKATTQTDAGGAGRFSWSSQPGVITTFRTKQTYTNYNNAAFVRYKLYSSNKMVADGDDNLSEDVPGDWDQRPETFVDLNAPVIEESGDAEPRLHFPIIDPRAFRGTVGSDGSVNNTKTDGPAGFGFTDKTSAGKTVAGVKQSDGSDARLPMPVRWLYMLQDGTIGSLDNAGSFVRSFGNGTPSLDNPMTQRFAFWTDDETNKINVNTASEGGYWNNPMTLSSEDQNFAKNPPGPNELQMFPGQPALNSLSVVFDQNDQIPRRSFLQSIYNAAPKVQWGGSQDGTKAGTTVPLDQDRLYATEDEYLFGLGKANSSVRSENDLFNSNVATTEQMEQARFFLTASSSGPETTLFGTPRISMWGMATNVGNRSPYDNLIAYCSTLPLPTNPNALGASETYFFLREQKNNRHGEIYGNTGRNIRLLQKYIWPLTSLNNPIPGFGGTFAQKYGAGDYQDCHQIGTELFDYLRNINVAERGYAGGGATTQGYGQTASCCICGGSGPHVSVWSNQKFAYPKGFGRMYSLSEAALVFICSADKPSAEPQSWKGSVADLEDLEVGQRRIEASLALEGFCPSLGYTGVMPNIRLQVIDGSKPLASSDNQRTDPPIMTVEAPAKMATQQWLQYNAPGQSPYVVGNSSTSMQGRRVWGGTSGLRMFLSNNSNGGGEVLSWKGKSTMGKVQNGHIIVNSTSSSLSLKEMSVRIILYDDANDQSTGNLIQAFDLEFPSLNVPIPTFTDEKHNTWKERASLGVNKLDGEDDLIMGGNKESVRSLVVSHGDYRLINARRIVKKQGKGDDFQPHPKYDGNDPHAHSLTKSDGSLVTGAEVKPLVSGVTYAKGFQPDFPMSASAPNYNTYQKSSDPYYAMSDPAVSGDYDTGLSLAPDGAYINRPDEGSSAGFNAYYNASSLAVNTPVTSPALLTPNRLVSGPVQFGSLSTGVLANIPWRTLLFRPDAEHFGAHHGSTPPDHLFLDLFWMPIVEPYAISAPFATAGKVNLNYQIAPFDYIKRQTALHSVLKNEKVIAIPTSDGGIYKTSGGDYYKDIDIDETLKQFEDKFKRGELFRSATEICEMYLVPEGEKLGSASRASVPGGGTAYDYKSMRSFWGRHKLTGDNLKERPYASIYPRLTTKSNTYRVHMIVQHLKKARSTAADTFDPDTDRITSQWRGSANIERSIDPNNKKIPSYFQSKENSAIKQPSLEYFYNYRVLNVKQFAP